MAMIDKNSLILGDCLDVMQDIPAGSVNMVLCDLPYDVLNKNNHEAKWDSVIPIDLLWNQYRRVTTRNAVVILFGQGMFTASVMQSNTSDWRYNLIWNKCRSTGFLNAKRQPMRVHEDIMVFCEGTAVYHPQMVKVSRHLRNHDRGKVEHQTNRCYGDFGKADFILSDEKYPGSIISIPSEHKTGRFFHSTQKPVDLCRYLIRTYTDEGMTVLDNTMGSGTTCVAAAMEHRHYIGIEKEQKYYDIAYKRVKAAEMQLSLF